MSTTTKTPVMFTTQIEIDQDVRSELVEIINQQLADTTDLFTQTKQAHWNVKGIHFFQLHELFDDLAKTMRKKSDTIAERATALGGMALGTTRMAANSSTLPEMPTDISEGSDYLKALVDRYAAYAASTRAAAKRSAELGDPTTEDMFLEVSRDTDEALYFLESHLQA
ncbi:MAG: DNA starvation/stationary phase protection protein Dps [Trueperaceae bacterium]|nr:DNA starvation/stationary phase protection protein Dps [Trueperaceae bacterium]